MPQLLFKRHFHAAIRDGRKTTTLRRWKSSRVKKGTIATVPGVGRLRIISCDQIDLKSLKRADALADGFSSLTQLRKALRAIYPDAQADGRHWYRIAFEVLNNAPVKAKARHHTRKKHGLAANRKRLARRIQAELDKVVCLTGSLPPL